MAEPTPPGTLAEELAAIPYEPLLPAEKWLITLSLILGTTLLGILVWISATYFPITPISPKKAKIQPTATKTTRP